jgi:hypothetical protein
MTRVFFITMLLATIALAADSTTKPATQPAEGAVNRFFGTISAVDEAAKTFTVDNQTYKIVGETQMTRAADGSAATIADVKVGETARGTFTKASDGSMNVTKVRFGRKPGGSKSAGSGGGGKAGGGKKAKDATTQPAQ